MSNCTIMAYISFVFPLFTRPGCLHHRHASLHVFPVSCFRTMSRAVLRKRKRLSKQQLSAVISNSSANLQSDSEDTQEKDEVEETLGDVGDDSIIQPSTRDVEAIYTVENIALLDILHLKDCIAVTATEKGMLLLGKFFHPVPSSKFFEKHWERSALVGHTGSGEHYRKILSRKSLEGTFSNQLLYEGGNVAFFTQRDLVAKERSNEDSDAVAEASDADESGDDGSEEGDENRREVSSTEIWSKYKAGYTVRLLTPQMYHDGVWKLLSALEHAFQCRVSAEAVLAPLNNASGGKQSAGKVDKETTAAVAFDNTNSIIVQLEGHSRWRVSPNPHADLQLPLSAGTVTLKAIDHWRKPAVDVTLSPGHTLYIPKGWVYQQDNNGSPSSASDAQTGDGHSLHLKICTHHGTTATVADLLEVVVPQALAEAVQSRHELRTALPRSYAQHLGVSKSETEGDVLRERLLGKISSLLQLVTNKAMDILDPAADQLVKQFIAGRLPVPLNAAEEACSAAGAPLATIYPYTQLRMLRPGIATAVVEDGKVVVYHCMDNSREFFGNPLSPLEFELDDGPAIEALLSAYPDAVTVSDLEHPSEELDDKIGVAQALYKEGFLLIVDEVSKPIVASGGKGKHDEKSGSAKKKKKSKQEHTVAAADDDDPF